MSRMWKFFSVTALVTMMMAAGCASNLDRSNQNPSGNDLTPPTAPPATNSGEAGNTFDHDNSAAVDPFELLKRQQEEGPAWFQARVHSCPKMKYRTLGNVLASRGVDLSNTTQYSAGNIYKTSAQSLGVANYAARVRESSELTSASATKLFDIFVAAAPEIIANMPNRPECQVNGVGAQMFNASGQCTVEGISCLIGQPATVSHVELCNQTVQSASTPELGQIIAVASLAAAAHTCE